MDENAVYCSYAARGAIKHREDRISKFHDHSSTLASVLDTPSGARTTAEPVEIDIAVATLLERLSRHPASAATLLPGYTIAPRPMTPAARAAMSLPKATAQRQNINRERLMKVWQVIEDEQSDNPDISDHGLAAALNRAGVLTYMARPFTASKVRPLLNQRKRENLASELGSGG